MDRSEAIKILAVLRAAYPQFYAKQTNEDLRGIVNLWADMFEDEPYQLVAAATKALIKTRTSTFPPGIGEISEKIRQISAPEEMTEAEAWALVAVAVRNGTYGAEKEFNALPPMLQRLVGSPRQLKEWAAMDADAVNSVVASNFQRSYKARAKNEREYEALPSSIKDYMAAIADGMRMPELEGGKT